MEGPKAGQTVTLGAGPAYFTRCMDCKRLLAANGIAWSPDFPGDKGGSKDMPARCSDCAKRRR